MPAPTSLLPEGSDPARRDGQPGSTLLRPNTAPLIKVADLLVPGVGSVQPLDKHPYAVLLDGSNDEVEIASLALSALGDYPVKTLRSYANGMLKLSRFLWAIGSGPETLTTREYRAYRRWLNHCQTLPVTLKVPGRHDPKRLVDITGHLASSSISQFEAAARTLYRALEEDEVITLSPVPPAARSIVNKGSNPLDNPVGLVFGEKVPGALPPIKHRNRRRPQPLNADLREHLLADPTARGRAMYRFMLESGPRIREVLSMVPENMHLDENYVNVFGKGLGGATRWVPISHAAVEAFEEYRDELAANGVHLYPGVPVWRSLRRPYSPISYDGIRDALKVRLALASTKKHSPHALRHTAATAMLVDLGMDVRRVQQILGHTFLTSTQVYLHADDATATRAFTEAWRNGRTRPPIDLTDLYEASDIQAFLGALDD